MNRINIGELNRRITYYLAGTSIDDGYGGFTVTAGTAVETWCGVQPMAMKEVLRYGLEDGSQPSYFGFYYEQGKNIKQGSELLFDGVTYRVRSVINVDQENDSVVVFAIKKV